MSRPTPSSIRLIADEAAVAARKLLTQLEHQGKSAGAEGLQLLENFNARMADLVDKRIDGKLSDLDLARACESEREALAFNVASVANETARAALKDVLGNSLAFLGSIIGAGLRALPGV